MTQKGEHTWDLVIDYKRCPKCGFINEDRQEFQYQMGSWVKDVTCSRCEHTFEVKNNRKLTFGPLIGMPQPPEITWE
jgi:rubredoxin